MTKYYRIAILVLVVVILALLARDRIGRASEAPMSNGTDSQGQPLTIQNPLPQAGEEQASAPQNQTQLAQVEGLVWNDGNGDGVQSIKERGIPDVTVNISNNSKTLVKTTTTDRNGIYQFKDLPPGEYFIVIFPPAGFVFSPQDQGVNELVDSDINPNTSEAAAITLVVGENDLIWTTGLFSPTAPVQAEPGTVKPPPTEIDVCNPGTNSLGGVAILQVNRLAANYCLHAFLWNHAFAIGRIPSGAGRVLAEVTFLEIFYQNRFVYKYDVQGETNSIQVCYAVPLGMQAQIYFFDFYGPRFGTRSGQPPEKPSWEPLQTTVTNGTACAVAQTSGAYALIGK